MDRGKQGRDAMAAVSYEANFASAMPVLRQREQIVADLLLPAKPTATEITQSKVAEIELHIKNGNEAFIQGKYANALAEFKTARTLIFAVLHPNFDAWAFLATRVDTVLPSSTAIERQLMDSSLRILDVIRPTRPDIGPVFGMAEELPAELIPYTKTGFRETASGTESIRRANDFAASLLADGKPEAAAAVLGEALKVSAGANVDPAVAAAAALNLSAALLGSNDPGGAANVAKSALASYEKASDPIGQAQALHLSAVAAEQLGKTAESQQLLARASTMLRSAESRLAGTTVVATRAGTPSAGGAVSPGGATREERISRSGGSHLPMTELSARETLSAEGLEAISLMDTQRLTFRIPGETEELGVISIKPEDGGARAVHDWTIGVPVGDRLVDISVKADKIASVDELIKNVYVTRSKSELFTSIDIAIGGVSTTASYLAHLYAYVLPVKMGDSYKALGQYAKAEEYYLVAAGYTYLNLNIEATSLWIRMAYNVLAWGDSLYKGEAMDAAKAQYAKLITPEGGVPAGYFYDTARLKVPADQARKLIQGIDSRPLPVVNWEISIAVLTAFHRLQQLLDGLDFYGLTLSPIHTFEYLQSVARSFAQEAIQAEAEFINFKTHQELEEAGRRDLETAKAMSDAEVEGRYQLWRSAIDDQQAAQKGVALATKRRDDAVSQRNTYASTSAAQIWGQAASTALSGGEDAYYSEISELADKLARGETIHGPGPKLAAAQVLYAGRKSRDYELKKMQDTIDELTAAIGISQEQLEAAQRRAIAAEIAYQAALQRADMATAALDAFDNEFFTPESWHKMADVMRDIGNSFLFRAIRIAKLMERAYNFENDTDVKVIKNDYGFKVGNPKSGSDTSLLGGQRLLLDIESFTYSAITSKTRKNSRIKDTISVAALFPTAFEEFRGTGLLSIETDLYEFDRLHPGFYGQRIEAVEVNIIGLLPDGHTGLNGTLTAGGVTAFRRKDGSTGKRLHQVDTMALSDFVLRGDVFLYSAETGVRGLFQGIGLGSTWQLHLPKRSNDFDFRRIFDIQFVLYYTAKYDDALRTAVLAMPPRPGEMTLLRTFALRYDFPDAWYAFYRDHAANFNLDRSRLPFNQQNFEVKDSFFRVVTKPGTSPAGITIALTAPGGATGQAQTDANGVVSTELPALAGLNGGSPVGAWRAEVIDGASLMDGATLKADRVYNIQFGLEYVFEAVPEAI
jgi:Tc toxin complex TcA C-terminal TcB-binding domain